jgi:tripartite-type tricarboxylate transporter receptor subunit TctC
MIAARLPCWLCAFLMALGPAALAQAPAADVSPLVIFIGSPPGTPGDAVARIIGGPLGVELGRPVVVENRPGAIGTIAMAAVARGRPDGSVLGILGLQAVVAQHLLPAMPYDTLRDLAPVRQVSSVSNVLVVRGDGPLATLEDVLAASRKGGLTYASGGNGTPAHLAAELFRQSLHLEMLHVPFTGAVAGVAAVMGGHVDMMFSTAPAALGPLKSGKLRALAVSAAARIPALSEVPTLAELGHAGLSVRDWHGLVAPAQTPPEVVAKIGAAVDKVLAAPAVSERLAQAGLESTRAVGSEGLELLIRTESKRWADVVKSANIKAD